MTHWPAGGTPGGLGYGAPAGPPPKKGPHVLVIAGAGCLVVAGLSALALLGTCGACVNALEPGELVYHASAGSCWLDVKYLDEDGEEVRRPRVRGMPESGRTSPGPWTRDMDLGPGDRYEISVAVAQSCMKAASCWVTYQGKELGPRVSGDALRDTPAVCHGTVPGR